jgi:hypothetical protein
MHALWKPIKSAPQPNNSSIQKIYDFTISSDEFRYLLADHKAPKKNISWKSWFATKVTKAIEFEENTNIVFIWDANNNYWVKLSVQPPFKPHAIRCIGNTLFALAYASEKETQKTHIMFFDVDSWHTIPTLESYTITQWGESVAIEGNNPSNTLMPESIWITFQKDDIRSTAHIKIINSDYGKVLQIYPYYAVSVGKDNSIWALDNAQDVLIKVYQDSPASTIKEEKIILSQYARNSQSKAMINKLYAVDKDTCYAISGLDIVYQWNSVINDFLVFGELPGIVSFGISKQLVRAITKTGQQWIWAESKEDKMIRERKQIAMKHRPVLHEIKKRPPILKETKTIESTFEKPRFPLEEYSTRALEQIGSKKFTLKPTETNIYQPTITREEYVQEKQQQKREPLLQEIKEKFPTLRTTPEPQISQTFKEQYLQEKEQEKREKEQKEHPERWALVPYQAPTVTPTQQERLDGKQLFETKPSTKNITHLVTWTALLTRIKTAIHNYLSPYIPNALLNWLNIQPKQLQPTTNR